MIHDHHDYIPDRFQKVIEKKLRKDFKGKDIVLDFDQAVSLHVDSTMYFPYFDVNNSNGDKLGYFVFKTTNACHFGGCIGDTKRPDPESLLFYDKIHYYVLLDTHFIIQNIRVLEHESDWGIEIGSRFWLKQFFDKKPGNFQLNENIDGISGATVSVEAMITDLNLLAPVENP